MYSVELYPHLLGLMEPWTKKHVEVNVGHSGEKPRVKTGVTSLTMLPMAEYYGQVAPSGRRRSPSPNAAGGRSTNQLRE